MIVWFAANIPSKSTGGVARSMQGLAEGLRMLGHETCIVTNSSACGGGYMIFALRLAVRLLMHRMHRPDWIIARSTDGVGCALLIKALGLKTRLAIHNHGWEEHVYELESRLPWRMVFPRSTWKARMIRFPLLRACLKLSDCCISGTLAEIRWLGKRYPQHRPKSYYVPNGVDVQEKGFWMGRDDAPSDILAIGGLTWKKNLHHTIDIFEELVRSIPGCRLFIIGAGIEKHRIERPFHPGIIVVPEVKLDEMTQWYRSCPFLLSSSRYEGGHSFALLEAMSHACVVFASAIPSSGEIIRNGENGLMISGVDAKNDAAAIASLLGDPTMLCMMRHRAFSSARRNRWERQAKRLERIVCLSR